MSEKELRKFSSELENAENTARIRLFEKAAKKYNDLAQKAQKFRPEMVSELQFLSSLYSLNHDISSRRNPHETGSIKALAALETSTPNKELSMTLPGGRFGEFPTTRIFTEVKAILTMYEGMSTGGSSRVRDAINFFLELGNQQLFFSRYLEPLNRRVTGDRAALESEARAQMIEGGALADPKPTSAVPHYMIAVRALRAARLHDEEARYRRVLTGLRTCRDCWFCGRQVQGADHLVWLKSTISPYFRNLLLKLKQDTRIIDADRLVACQPCFSAINNEADRTARAYFDRLVQEIQRLAQRVARLESKV